MKCYYTYKIYNDVVNKYYIGSRTASDKIDILNGYNTSSKVVRNLIKEYGINTFKIIDIVEYESAEDAIRAENQLLSSINVNDRNQYLNINFSVGDSAIIKSQSRIQIYNKESDKYQFHPKNVPIPKGWVLKYSFKPPSRKGCKLVINPQTKETKYISYGESLESGWRIKTEYDKEIYNNLEKRTEWITDGLINKKIKKSEELPNGWIFGKTAKRKHNIFINNGIIERELTPNEKFPIHWFKGKLIVKRTYVYNNIKFEYKKDLLLHLNMTATEFDYNIAKNRIKNITIYDNNIPIVVSDRYHKEPIKKENDKRGKDSQYQYIYNDKIFDSKTDILKYLNINDGVYNYRIKTNKLNVIRRKKNNGYYN